MTTTLIVRDATLAIHGAPEKRGEPREHLRLRTAEVAHLDERTASECVEVLASVGRGEGADPDVLEALLILALAQPALAARIKLSAQHVGRRLAARLERDGEIEHARAVLELLLQKFPGNDALERDMAQLLRRQGMVQDLVARYFERAKRCVAEGRPSEAAGWLREVLQLDPGRKDAARMIRDLRFKKLKKTRRGGGGGGWKVLLVAAALVAGLTWCVRRDLDIAQEFAGLPVASEANPASLERRLADLERFVARNPVWHGALGVLSERSELRVRLAVLEDQQRSARESLVQAERDRLTGAEQARLNGVHFAQGGDLPRAIASFRQALELGGPDWPEHERVARDLTDLEAHLSETP